jgi:hypothetical protein
MALGPEEQVWDVRYPRSYIVVLMLVRLVSKPGLKNTEVISTRARITFLPVC